MAKTTFTTWAAMRDAAKDKLALYVASGEFITTSFTDPDGNSYSFMHPRDLLRFIGMLDSMVEEEENELPRHRPMAVRPTRL